MTREFSKHLLRKFVVDVILISTPLLAVIFAIYATMAFWPSFELGFFCGDDSLMFPYHNDTVHVTALSVNGLCIPNLIFAIYATRAFWPSFERGFFCGKDSLMFPNGSDTATVNAFMIFAIYATMAFWPSFERGFFCGDESLMFPYRSDTVTVTALRIYGLSLPILAFLVCEWVLLRKEADTVRCLWFDVPAWLRGFYCALTSFGYGACFIELTTNIAKNVIGRPRPHFFDLCKPSVNCSSPDWQHRYIEPGQYRCTAPATDSLDDMHMSFLSGHSAWSAFTMFYLAFYLEKRMVWRGTRVLRHSLQFAAVMLSWYTALSRVSDYKHHWSDVLAGYFLGLTFAALVWTWGTDILEPKDHHKPVPTTDGIPLHRQRSDVC